MVRKGTNKNISIFLGLTNASYISKVIVGITKTKCDKEYVCIFLFDNES